MLGILLPAAQQKPPQAEVGGEIMTASSANVIAAPATRRRRPFADRRWARPVIGAAAILVFLSVWQVVGTTGLIRADLISYPSEIARTFWTMLISGELGTNAAVSLQEFVQGFIPAIVFGIAIGAGFALSARLRYLFEPLFVAINTSPIIAFVPIVVVWFGVGLQSKSVMVFLAAVIPIVINTMTGIIEVQESWIRACRAFGATPRQVVAKAILPGALPVIMAGIRLAIGRAIVGLIAAEMYVSVKGIGRLIQVYSTSDSAAEIFVLVGIVSSFGLLLVTALRWLENYLAPWGLER